MSTPKLFSCYLIGADTLLIECGEILITKGHDIRGVITNTPRLRQWAIDKGIATIAEDHYADKLKNDSFDYLFSITHLSIIKDDVLALPACGTINFHDGPLPKYAGLNAPAWAIMAGEEEYGISWHQVVAGVDKGDLLKQAFFSVASDETSLSINTKCFAAAVESFPELIDELATSEQRAIQQNLDERSYFGKYKRPERDGFIAWSEPAQTIESLVRALDFGDYPNLLTSPKVLIHQHVFIVKSAIAREQQVDVAAGEIIAMEEGLIDVATSEGIISLTQLADLKGRVLSAGELQNRLALKVGQRFTEFSPEQESSLKEVSDLLARSDEYWAKRLTLLEPVEIPYASTENTDSLSVENYRVLPLTIASSNPYLSTAAFCLLMSRLNRKNEFDIAFSSPETRVGSCIVPQAYSEFGALHIGFEASDSPSQLLALTQKAIAELDKRRSWAKDCVARHPALAAIPELMDDSFLPVGVNIYEQKALEGTVVTLSVAQNGQVTLLFDSQKLTDHHARRLADQFTALHEGLQQNAAPSLNDIELLSQAEKAQLLTEWNNTAVDYDNSQCLHHLFEAQAALHPNATALVFEDQTITYGELNVKANRLAHLLIEKGFGQDDLVGVNVHRSIDLMVATIGIHKAGAAYVPLDPAFPADRIAYMVEDAKMRLVITQSDIEAQLPESNADIVCIDTLPASEKTSNPAVNIPASALAYVIYTSGSTGNPKGVMVEHRNATNFFVGMDERIEHTVPGTWLAVTSLSFDISVLELFWTLTRGFKVVIYREDRAGKAAAKAKAVAKRPMAFGLFMWGNDDAPGSQKYKLMLEGAKYFDENGFDSVWTPERHFSAFGGPYPNPAVTCAALAAVTKNVAIRSGSIVSPLHHPVRIAEDWAVIDNLSDGRVGLSFAAGWQPNDFVILPENHKNNKQVMLDQIEIVKKLWRGEKVAFKNPLGNMVELETLPRPVQKELPVWLTTAGNPESYRLAGEMGVNVLTHLLGQSLEEVTEKIRIYREARKAAGFDPATGKVTLMLHTFVGTCNNHVRELVREPMKDYLRSAMKLVLDFAWAFPAFKRPGGPDSKPEDIDIKGLSDDETDTILDFAFERYYETSGLFGTPDTCAKMVERCKASDIDEIACLLDFGVDTAQVMQSLPLLKSVRERTNAEVVNLHEAEPQALAPSDSELDQSFAAQVERHGVTHFQCTPSMARMLTFDDDSREKLSQLKHMMIGGEAFPNALAKDLKALLTGRLTNMYGPTETTIWSTTQEVTDPANIPIGRPIANTDIYILDPAKHPVPPGVPGDLYIGGAGVVRGYLHRPELTAERFIENPFKKDGSRMYWTGDLARYREDGVIEFLGRVDHQVKIRGYRIELGEIEALLGSHPSVSECVLLLREDTPGDQRLVAYVVSEGTADTAVLKEHLRTRLPEYMVPNDFMLLDAMPLTPNGKLDRKQLPIPSGGAVQAAASVYEAPKTELQQTIVEVWQDTLKLEKIGVNDNFFDLGGHSLLIVRVHQLLKERVEKPISLTDLYRFPTIARLTEFLNADDKKNESLKKSSDRASRRRERMGLRRRGRK